MDLIYFSHLWDYTIWGVFILGFDYIIIGDFNYKGDSVVFGDENYEPILWEIS